MLFMLRSSSQRSLNKYNINKEGGNNADDINDQQNQRATVCTVEVVDYWWRNVDLQKKICRIVHCCQKGKEESFGAPKMGLFLCFILLKVVQKSNGLIEMYRGSQGRVAMTTSIYCTMTCFEFLSMLFEYVIRVLLLNQITRRAKLWVFHVCQNAHRHRKR